MNLSFTYKSCDTLEAFTSLITAKSITELNLELSGKFVIENLQKKLSWFKFPRQRRYLVISDRYFAAEDGKLMTVPRIHRKEKDSDWYIYL